MGETILLDTWKIWKAIFAGLGIGVLYFFIGVLLNLFLIIYFDLPHTFLNEFIFLVFIAFFSYFTFKNPRFGLVFGFVVSLVAEIISSFFGTYPFGYLFSYPELWVAFAILVFRLIGFPVVVFLGSYLWTKRTKENLEKRIPKIS